MMTVQQYYEALYNERCKNKMLKEIYEKHGGFTEYLVNQLAAFGLSDWFKTINPDPEKVKELTVEEVRFIVETKAKYSVLNVSGVPYFLTCMCRDYNLELPAEAGILTEDYWNGTQYLVDKIKRQ